MPSATNPSPRQVFYVHFVVVLGCTQGSPLYALHSCAHSQSLSCVYVRFRNDQKCKTRVPETFQGWDPEVRKLLPLYVQESFPFVLTRKSAIHRDVIADVADNLMHAKGFKASSEALEQAHRHKFHSAELKYYNMLLWRRAEQLDSGAEDGFGSFQDAKGYNGFFPSAHYLSSVWSTSMQQAPVAKLDKHVKGVEGEVRTGRNMDFFQEAWVQGNDVVVDKKVYCSEFQRAAFPFLCTCSEFQCDAFPFLCTRQSGPGSCFFSCASS